MLGEHVGEEDPDGVAEEDGVGDLHHRGLEVQGEQHAPALGVGDLVGQERFQRSLAHDGGVEDLAGLEAHRRPQRRHRPVRRHQLDGRVGGGPDRDGALVGPEVAVGHGLPEVPGILHEDVHVALFAHNDRPIVEAANSMLLRNVIRFPRLAHVACILHHFEVDPCMHYTQILFAEAFRFAGVAEQQFPADRPDHEREIKRRHREPIDEGVGLADGAKAGAVVELDVGQHDDEHHGEDSERDQGARIRESLAKGGLLDHRLRRNGGGLHLAVQHIRVRPPRRRYSAIFRRRMILSNNGIRRCGLPAGPYCRRTCSCSRASSTRGTQSDSSMGDSPPSQVFR